MGLIGGMMSSGLAQGAGDVAGMAQGQIDVNNKNQVAAFQSQLDTDRAAAVARLQQSIHNEDAINAATGPVGDATRVGTDLNTRAAAATAMSPDVLASTSAVEGAKPYNLEPGQERFQNGKQVASNDRITKPEADKYLYENQLKGPGAGGGAAKAAGQLTAEQDKVLQETVTNVNKAYADPATGKPIGVAGAAAADSYTREVANGRSPGQAAARAQADVDLLASAASSAMRANPDQYKGMSQGDVMSQMYRQAVAAQRGSPAPAPGGPAAAPSPGAPAKTPAAAPSPAAAAAPTPADGDAGNTPAPADSGENAPGSPGAKAAAARASKGSALADAQKNQQANEAAWNGAVADAAKQKFKDLDLTNLAEVQKFQDSQYFDALTNAQKTQVSKALRGLQ